MNFVSEPILSRKISITSVTRHFAGWKVRHFTLDRTNQLLEIFSSESKRNIIQLQSASVSLGRHFYSADEYFWFWIKYYDNSEKCYKEIIMKFEKQDDLIRWESALSLILLSYKGYLQEAVPSLIDILGGLIKEKADCEHIVKDEDGYEGSYFSHETNYPNNADLDTNNSLADSFYAGVSDEYSSSPAVEMSSSTLYRSQFLDKANSNLHSSKHPLAISIDASAIERSTFRLQQQQQSLQQKSVNEASRVIRKIQMPRLNILIMAVGTRGDIQPFTQFGVRLKQDGHRIRLATHECFRSYILSHGLEFYPLGGDPVLLSEFMVKTGGSIFPLSSELLKEVPKFHAMIVEIIYSAWKACLEVDPGAENKLPFAADAIISNPVTYAHIHCAEALGIPLHLFFPQPWVPTKAFPHPLSRMSYNKQWSAENYLSYELVDRALWISFERELNLFRQSIGLQALRLGQHGWNLCNYHQIPFVKMWSSAIVPKPKDWQEYVDIVGTFFDTTTDQVMIRPLPVDFHIQDAHNHHSKSKSKSSHRLDKSRSFDPRVRKAKSEDSLFPIPSDNYEPAVELMEFLYYQHDTTADNSPNMKTDDDETRAADERDRHYEKSTKDTASSSGAQASTQSGKQSAPIIFIGFGSMIIPDMESIISLFLEAAALTNTRILFQEGWSKITPEKFEELAILAQQKAEKVESTMTMFDLEGSVIFPKHTTAATGTKEDKDESKEMQDALLRLEANADEHVNDVDESQTVAHDKQQRPVTSPPAAVTPPAAAAGLGNWIFDVIATSFGSTSGFKPLQPLNPPPSLAASAVNAVESKEGLSDWSEVTSVSPVCSHLSVQAANANAQAATQADGIASIGSSNKKRWTAAHDVFYMGQCPHTWLFPHVTAVIHHGGAGTTSTGIRHACPTWILPFFGDQFFWGEMIYRAALGPAPCTLQNLTLTKICNAFTLLIDPKTIDLARKIGEKMAQENGIENAVAAFYQRLPVENMVCEVTLFQDHEAVKSDWNKKEALSSLAQVYCHDCQLKMTVEIANQIHSDQALHMQHHILTPCCYVDYTLPKPATTTEGVIQGLGGFVHELLEGVADVVYDPVKGAYDDGIAGGAQGLVKGLGTMVDRQIQGGIVLYEKIKEGSTSSVPNSNTADNTNHDATSTDRQSLRQESNEQPNSSTPVMKKKARSSHGISHEASEKTLSFRRKRLTIMQQLHQHQLLQQQEKSLACSSESAVSSGPMLQQLQQTVPMKTATSELKFTLPAAANFNQSLNLDLNHLRSKSETILELSRETDSTPLTTQPPPHGAKQQQSREREEELLHNPPDILLRSVDDAFLAGMVVKNRIPDPFEDQHDNIFEGPERVESEEFIPPDGHQHGIDLEHDEVDEEHEHQPYFGDSQDGDKMMRSYPDLMHFGHAGNDDESNPPPVLAISTFQTAPAVSLLDSSPVQSSSANNNSMEMMIIGADSGDDLLFTSQMMLPKAETGDILNISPFATNANNKSDGSFNIGGGIGFTSRSSIALTPERPATAVCSPPDQTVAALAASHDKAEKVTNAFIKAKEALTVFQRLGGKDIRMLSERHFMKIMNHALARYESMQGGAEVVNSSNNPHIFVPYRSMEQELLRRPEQREALIKHFMKGMTRSRNCVEFVDFALLFQDVMEQQDTATLFSSSSAMKKSSC